MMEDCAIKYYNEGKAKILYSFPEYVFKEMLIRSKLILIYMKGRFQIFKIFEEHSILDGIDYDTKPKYQRAIWYHPQRPENKETLIYPGEHYT